MCGDTKNRGCQISYDTWGISSPAPYTLHVVTTDMYLHISGYSTARGILCACVFLVIILFLVPAQMLVRLPFRAVHIMLA